MVAVLAEVIAKGSVGLVIVVFFTFLGMGFYEVGTAFAASALMVLALSIMIGHWKMALGSTILVSATYAVISGIKTLIAKR
jgi:hypothetical protein